MSVLEATPSGPADRGGLADGDIICNIAGRENDGIDTLLLMPDGDHIGRPLSVTLFKNRGVLEQSVIPVEKAE